MKNQLSLNNELRQQQRLTPLQVQFVRILEMSAPEVEEEVRHALDDMPALEAVDSDEAPLTHTTEDGAEFDETDRDLQLADYSSPDDVPSYLESPSDSDAGARFQKQEASAMEGLRITRAPYDPDRFVQPEVSDMPQSLAEHLEEQIAELPLTPTQRTVAEYIIGSLDSNGYMSRSLQALVDDLAINEGVMVEELDVENVWQQVRRLDPPGIAATDLQDCLEIQLRRLPRSTRSLTALEIITRHFRLFSKKHFDKIAFALGITREQLADAIELITHLNPKPGSPFAVNPLEDGSAAVSPDFLVEVTDDNRLNLSLLNRIPELRVEASFATDDVVTPSDADSPERARSLEAARTFVRRKRDDARDFIKIISLRNQTLFKVMSAILQLQKEFFLTENDEAIRPMVLKDIEKLTGLNLSVISRATQGKYVATQRAVYPLKKFFNERIRRDDDNPDLSANKVIAEMRRIIGSEDPANPLSDREITEQLESAGYPIARRTVAKYREQLGFPVARLRGKC